MTRSLGRMTRTRSLMSAVVCAALVVACESPGPRLPTSPELPSAPVPPPAPAGGTHTLSGVVTAGGQPAVGARVAVLELDTEPSATTDDKGYYSISGLATSHIWGRTLVRFSLPGTSPSSSGRAFRAIPRSISRWIRWSSSPWEMSCAER